MVARLNFEQKFVAVWWVRMLFGMIFLGISYALLSLAIDSAKTLEYFFGLIFLWAAIREFINVFKVIRKGNVK